MWTRSTVLHPPTTGGSGAVERVARQEEVNHDDNPTSGQGTALFFVGD
ncbi:hypothetical protein ACVOMT_00040 [Sphingomonas panni]